jgi:spermidine synthase
MTKLSAKRTVNQWVLLIFLLSGMTGLVYEIVWMKLLVLVMGNTVYSTTTVLAAFMGGLGLGSFLAGRFLHRISLPLKTYGYLEGAIGLYALAVPLLVAAADPLFGALYRSGSASSLSLVRLIVCGGILLVPTTLMGATLPLLSAYLADRETDLGWTIGKLYGINTLGAVFGAASAGFLLIPNLGLSWSSRGTAFVNLAIAGLILWRFEETPIEAATVESAKPDRPDRPASKKNKKR